jgi:diguanylate cyclase (GGDEF)-like protein
MLYLQQKLAKRFMQGLLIMCLIGLPLSLFRWYSIGFQSIFIVHFILSILTFVVYRIAVDKSAQFMFAYFVFFMTLLAASGSLSYGLQSGAVTFAILSVIALAIGFGMISSLFYLASWIIYFSFMAYLFTHEYLGFAVNPSIYAKTGGAWAIVIFGTSITSLFLLIGSYEYFKGLSTLMKKLEDSEKHVQKLANHDYLTGVATLRLADEQLQFAISNVKRKNTTMALLFIDLDDFKLINDEYGHDAGDAVLKNIASLLSQEVRKTDVVARIGGDEFMLIISEPVNREKLSLFCERLIDNISQPTPYKNSQLSVGVSIGISLFPDNAHNIRDLKQQADYAMYRAKNAGKNKFCFYE